MTNESKHFNPMDADLPGEERAARTRRQQHAEWGVAVARLGDIHPDPVLLRELQRYIDGELSLADLLQRDHPPGSAGQLYNLVAQREAFAG